MAKLECGDPVAAFALWHLRPRKYGDKISCATGHREDDCQAKEIFAAEKLPTAIDG
jgi:hypothetical protein